jgi:uroporphyrinogen decarboxylase
MTDRERFLNCALGRNVDRPPYWLFWGPWGGAWRRWQREGMPAAFTGYGDVRKHFGAEAPPAVVPVRLGPWPSPAQTLEDTDQHRIFIDSWGIQRRDIKSNNSMSEFIAFPVKSRADWERYQAERLVVDDPRRLEGDWLDKAKAWMAAGVPIQLGSYPDVGFYGTIRWLLGDEDCLLAIYDDPGLVHDIMEHMADLYLAVFEKVLAAGVRVDVIHIWEDMCGRQGPLISPAHFEQFMAPRYRRIKAFADAHQIPLISVDTDGWPDALIDPMMNAGVNYLFPFEVAAGCDVNDFGGRYPGLCMMGGIDKRVLARDAASIDAELERLRPAIQRGRYIPDLDHLVPDDVPWPNFCYYAERLAKAIGKT